MIALFVPAGAERPEAWIRSAVTRDGVAYRIRPIRADDVDRERTFLRELSGETRWFRFLHAIDEPPAGLLDALVHVDGGRTMAFVAVIDAADGEKFIGVARYASDDSSGSCEFALAISDDWQARGVGSTLLRMLFDYARAVGIKRAYATIHPQNVRMIDLARFLELETHNDPSDAGLLVASRALG